VTDGWRIVLWLHLLAMAFFIGGQLVFGFAVVPLLRGDGDRETLRAVARRFGYGSLVALGLLIITGGALASHFELWSSPTLQAKLGLVALVIVLALAHLRWARVHLLQSAILVASLAIAYLGVVLATGG
jgi:uncharacterized membrane protein